MCIIIAAKEPAKITEDIVRTCWENNSHGAGLAYVENSRIKVVKELDSVEKFVKLHKKHTEKAIAANSKMLLHFRIATHGTRTVENVHPFWVSKSVVMCHNGVLHKIKPQEDRSDTNTFCFYILRKLGNNVLNPINQFFIKDYIGSGNKLAFLSADGSIVITNQEAGKFDEELNAWFSNESYKKKNIQFCLNDCGGYSRAGFKVYEGEKGSGPKAPDFTKTTVRCAICRRDAKIQEKDFFVNSFGDIFCENCGERIKDGAEKARGLEEELEDTQEIPRALIGLSAN